MPTVTIENITFSGCTIKINGLQEAADLYDKFVYEIYQNNSLVFNCDYIFSSMSKNPRLILENDSYLGYNYLSPNCDYEVRVACHHQGIKYPLTPVSFSTPSISPPTGSIAPSIYVPVRDQGQTGSCVAESLACGMDIFKAKNTGITYEKFSASFIYGSDEDSSGYGMYYEDAVNNCQLYGSPRYEIFTGKMPEQITKREAVAMYHSADSLVRNNATGQKVNGGLNIDFYDCNAVKNCIATYGCFMFTFRVPNNFDQVNSSGIIPQPNWWRGDGHMLVLIGLTTIGGKKYWIAQNSWGDWWGDGGRCFIPYDWGCRVQAPTSGGSSPTSWTTESYSVRGDYFSGGNPNKPCNLTAQQMGVEKTASLNWSCSSSADSYVVLARAKYTNRWYRKVVVSSKTATVPLDDYNEYEFIIIAMLNNLCSDVSAVVTVNITDHTIIPVNYSNIDSIQSGRPVHIYASDITDFRNTIYELYDLKGIARENFNDDVATGTVIQARHINNFYYRIQRLGGSFYTIGVGSSITAKVFLDLRNAINHIIRGL